MTESSPTRQSNESLSDFNRAVFDDREFEPRESRLRKAYALFEEEAERGKLLDVAAGSGIAAEALGRQGWEVSALELSERLADQIRARGISDVRVHDLINGVPYPDDAFDALFAGEIIEHLVDTGAFLAEVRRVLSPGGIAVITTPNLASLENRLRLLFGVYPRWVEYELSDQGHVRSYTAPTLARHLAQSGFDVERLVGNFVPVITQRVANDLFFPWLARTGDWLPKLSQGLIVKARRR